MGYINQSGKFNDTTWLIDAAFKTLEGNVIRGGHAAYLIKTEDNFNCLINAGTQSGAKNIYKGLIKIGAWPLQRIIITHSHWDHTQGIIYLRNKEIQENLPQIEIFASKKALPRLSDQSYNYCFTSEEINTEYQNIEGVIPLEKTLQLGSHYFLEIIETPGHMEDHISVYDKQTKTLFCGDTIGMHWFPKFYVCNANSIYWKEKDYLESMRKMKSLDTEYLCIAHFGVLTENDIPNFIDKSVSMYYRWMEVFERFSDRIEDFNFIVNQIWDNVYKEFHTFQMLKETLIGAVKNAIVYYNGIKKA
ncbi:MAG: MBL fold metallo-hydrolase [Promethearchaeota archaeon]|jgi:glyoxylase-like metal-dependent hydrolase (beta-lactamase superfamily II)